MLCMEAVFRSKETWFKFCNQMVQMWIVQRNSPILFWRFRGVIDSNSLSENRFHAQHLLPHAVDKIINNYVASIYEAYQADIDLSLEDSRREVARWTTSWAIRSNETWFKFCNQMVQKWIVQRNSPILFWCFRGVIDSNSLSTTSDISNDFIS
jgi:hypothetical protein